MPILLGGVLYFWWGQYMLLGGHIAGRNLLPGAVVTVVGLVDLRWFMPTPRG
ncbi:hypothetical protein ABZ442_29620 [Streptomyces triculaminicus]|uniref:hypothetical protein n=1 Tax=Streptomyces triculaminicus TaxID=2816232 RepID=UPI0033FCFF7B